ncbi:MAG: beta-N-acetylhexosaminidase [Candidatus Pacebacteria bacterium]|nr:beta-N-acetylhexosaminidase [Candidatus Paceibacterota bacterium]
MSKRNLILTIIVGIVIIASIMILVNKKEVNSVSLDEKIGQMLILGFRGLEVNESSKIINDINKYNIGGVILFDYDVPSKTWNRNIESPNQTKKLIEDIRNLTRGDLVVAVDAEGGYVNRLKSKYGFAQIDSAQKMGEGEKEQTFLKASPLGLELNYLGFNLNFAPVVDVNINPDNPAIGYLERSFNNDPEKVYEHADAFIDTMHEYNIATAIKHFPGHGSSKDDSHLGLVDVTNTYDKEKELLPYKKLIEDNKLDMIMTAHVMNQNIDSENPATLSPIFLEDILRNELGYNGIIVSDDMQMGAIIDNFGFDEAIIKAINAGCNLLIFSNNNNREYDEDIAQKAVNVIKKAAQNGQISEETINDSYNKIQALKQKYGI